MGKILEQAFYKRGIPNVSYLTKRCSTSSEIQLYSDQMGKSGLVLQCCLCHKFKYTHLYFWTLNSVRETLCFTGLESKPLSYVEMEEGEFLLHKIRGGLGFFFFNETYSNQFSYLSLASSSIWTAVPGSFGGFCAVYHVASQLSLWLA